MAIIVAAVGAPARLAGGRPLGPVDGDRPTCVLLHRKVITPTVLNAGQVATVTLAVRPDCVAVDGTMRDLTVTDALTGGIDLVPGSARPPADVGAGRGVTLTWRATTVPAAGLTFTYRLTAPLRGHWPTSARTVATYADPAGRRGHAQLDDTHVVARTPGQAGPGACWIDALRGSLPSTSVLGRDLPLQLVFRASCPPELHSTRLVFALDAGRMADGSDSLEAMGDAISDALRRLPRRRPRTRYGVVGFDAKAWTACEPSDDVAEVDQCLSAVAPGDGHDLAAGVREGIDVLGHNQRLGPPPAPTRDVVLVYATAPVTTSCPSAVAAADAAKQAGILVITVCAGANCLDACLTEVASSPRFAFALARHDEVVDMLRKVFVEMVDDFPAARVDEVLAPDVGFVADSADPEPGSSADRRLTWSANYIPRDGVTITYAVRPIRLGEIRPIEAATVTVTNYSGATWLRPPLPAIRVVPPRARLFLPALGCDR